MGREKKERNRNEKRLAELLLAYLISSGVQRVVVQYTSL